MMVARLYIPGRPDVWLADFGHEDPSGAFLRHREQGGVRPCIVVSRDSFNRSPAELVVVVPVTSQDKAYPYHIRIEPLEGGPRRPSFAMCEGIRSIARQFLIKKYGQGEDSTMQEIARRLSNLILP